MVCANLASSEAVLPPATCSMPALSVGWDKADLATWARPERLLGDAAGPIRILSWLEKVWIASLILRSASRRCLLILGSLGLKETTCLALVAGMVCCTIACNNKSNQLSI